MLVFVNRKAVGWVITIFSLSFTAVFHIYRMILHYGRWDTTIVQLLMVQVIHLSNVAWDYTDGELIDKKENKNPKALKDIPDFFEYLSSGVIPSQCLGGPCTHLYDYHRFIYKEEEFSQNFKTAFPAFRKFLVGITWLAVYICHISFFPLDLLYSTQFSGSSFLMRVYPYL